MKTNTSEKGSLGDTERGGGAAHDRRGGGAKELDDHLGGLLLACNSVEKKQSDVVEAPRLARGALKP